MVNYVVSGDIGNGNTVAVMKGVKRFVRFPSIRVRTTAKTLGLGKGSEVQLLTALWKGDTYAVGDDTLMVNRNVVDRHMGANRYGGEMHQFLTAYALACLGVKSGNVDLTLLCPPAMYNDLKKQMIDLYTAKSVQIKLKGDKEPREWVYESVTIRPEGYAAVGCFMLDEEGKESPLKDKVSGNILLLDTGAFTTNVFRLHQGAMNPADLPKSSIAEGGGNTHIRQPLLEFVRDGGGDMKGVTLDDVDRVLRLASISGDYMLHFGGQKTDLKPMLDYLSKQYADWLANQLDSNFNGLQDINGLLIVGGNAPYITPYLQAWYKKVIEYTGWREFARLHPADLNAVGGLRMALARLAAKK